MRGVVVRDWVVGAANRRGRRLPGLPCVTMWIDRGEGDGVWGCGMDKMEWDGIYSGVD
jgi:hypothetical protein